MKSRLTIATLLVCGSLVMAFAAAKVETCAEKYAHCTEICGNQKANNKASGKTEQSYEASYKSCMKACDKAKADCEKNTKK